MGSFSIWHWLIVLAIVLVVFGGKGKLSNLLGDLGQGVKNFKKGLASDEDAPAAPTAQPRVLSADAPEPAPQPTKDEAARH